MTQSRTCPTCRGTMKKVTPYGYFCMACMTTLTILEEGWVHILTPDFREKRVREDSLS